MLPPWAKHPPEGEDAGAPMAGQALLKPNTQHEAREHQDISWHPDATLHLPQHPRERGWLGLGCSWGLLGLGYRLGWAHPSEDAHHTSALSILTRSLALQVISKGKLFQS